MKDHLIEAYEHIYKGFPYDDAAAVLRAGRYHEKPVDVAHRDAAGGWVPVYLDGFAGPPWIDDLLMASIPVQAAPPGDLVVALEAEEEEEAARYSSWELSQLEWLEDSGPKRPEPDDDWMGLNHFQSDEVLSLNYLESEEDLSPEGMGCDDIDWSCFDWEA